MFLNLLVHSYFGKPSSRRILLHEYRGLRGFTLFRKGAFLTNMSSEAHEILIHSVHWKFTTFHSFRVSMFAYFVLIVFGMRFIVLWLHFGSPLALLDSLSVPFGSISLPFLSAFGSLPLAFWSVWVSFRSTLFPFGSFWGRPGASRALLWIQLGLKRQSKHNKSHPGSAKSPPKKSPSLVWLH